MRKRPRYGKTRCRGCGAMVTNNALGRSRHNCDREIERRRKEAEAAGARERAFRERQAMREEGKL